MSGPFETPRIIERLDRLEEICLAMPETEAIDQTGQHRAFKIRGKTFVYQLVDHHDDGMVALNCKVAPGEARAMQRSSDYQLQKNRFYEF